MTYIIINPGTEPQPDATEENANEIIRRFVDDLQLPHTNYGRCAGLDPNYPEGFFAYVLRGRSDRFCQVDVPGVDPDRVQRGEPWVSPRLYVNGSSWLWGFALDAAHRALTGEDE